MGGNVILDGESAERIDLRQIDRKKVVFEIRKGLQSLSEHFKMRFGQDLWSPELLESCQFLSGSALHLFNLDGIPDSEFVKYKPTVGDIDTQVDETQKESIDRFLSSLPVGFCVDTLTFLGFKRTDQFVTLWKLIDPAINVQIDLELVAFDSGRPTAWSQFSHSSSWEDLKLGIKGLFKIYLFRSIQHTKSKDIIIQPKTHKGKEKIIHSAELAFSLKGLRYKIRPVLDDQGNHLSKNGMLVYTDIDTSESTFITDFELIFEMIFGKTATKEEIERMKSFNGLVSLVKQYMSKTEQEKILQGFIELLWGKGAQGLVRGDPIADYDTKIIALEYLSNQLGVILPFHDKTNQYYKAYR
jgi:hypothetical protein